MTIRRQRSGPPRAPNTPGTPGTGFANNLAIIDGGLSDSAPEPGATSPGGAAQPFDEDAMLVASWDKGQMEPVTFKIQEQYLAWARLITESRRFPMLRTRSDIARLGWERVVAWLTSLNGDAAERSVMHQIELMNTKLAWERRRLDYVKFIENYAPIIQEQLALPGGRLHAARVLREMRRHMAAMEPSFYTSLFETMFNDRFSAYEQAGLTLIEVAAEGEGEEGSGAGLVEEGAHVGNGSRDGAGGVDMEEMMREIEDMLGGHNG